ncbi:MAG: TolC family protein, partial [Candidatus Tenebribacter mawsonii]|nr:TolC family protein [Candidatus Tenebribacter mawsonii]
MRANPEISSLEFQIEALNEKEIFVQKLMDPMLAIEYSNVPYNTWKLDENPMSGIQLKLKQTIPFPGKNSKRKAVVESEGQIKIHELDELKLQLKDKVKKAYYQLGLNRELKVVSLKHIALLEDLIKTMINKYEIGKSAQSDILRMTLMKEKLLDDLEDFKQKESEIQATLNSVLNRDVRTFISTESLNLNFDLDLDNLLKTAIQNRPLLKKIEETSKMKRLVFKLAQRERMPDLTLWAGYRIRKDIGTMENIDFASLGFSFPIPLDMKGRTKAKMNNAKFMEKGVDEKYKNVVNKISEMLIMATSGLERQKNKISNYNINLIPDAEKVFHSELSSYTTGRANFADLYQAQLQLIQFEKILLKSKFKFKMYEVTIETLIGEKL